MLGFPILYFKGMRILMFQLSGFYCKVFSRRCFECRSRGAAELSGKFKSCLPGGSNFVFRPDVLTVGVF